jgi:hypothetical protein
MTLTFNIPSRSIFEIYFIFLTLLFIYGFGLFLDKRTLITKLAMIINLNVTLTITVKYKNPIIICSRQLDFLIVFFTAIFLFDFRSKKKSSVFPAWQWHFQNFHEN